MSVKLTEAGLRRIITEEIAASKAYASKEKIREDMQARLVDLIASGDIKDESGLKDYFDTVDMAAKALKMVPYSVFVKLASSKKKTK